MGAKDMRLRGHEFHYATIEAKSEGDTPFAFVQDAHGGAEQAEGNRRGKVTGSFFHVIAADEPNGTGPRRVNQAGGLIPMTHSFAAH